MTTHAVGRADGDVRTRHVLSPHGARLGGGLVLAFALPYVLADVLEINRDLFYGLYAAAVIALFALWSRSTGYDLVAAARRRWLAALLLGLAVAAVLAAMVVRTEDTTARPMVSVSGSGSRTTTSCFGGAGCTTGLCWQAHAHTAASATPNRIMVPRFEWPGAFREPQRWCSGSRSAPPQAADSRSDP